MLEKNILYTAGSVCMLYNWQTDYVWRKPPPKKVEKVLNRMIWFGFLIFYVNSSSSEALAAKLKHAQCYWLINKIGDICKCMMMVWLFHFKFVQVINEPDKFNLSRFNHIRSWIFHECYSLQIEGLKWDKIPDPCKIFFFFWFAAVCVHPYISQW